MTKGQTEAKLPNANEIAMTIFTSPTYGFDKQWQTVVKLMQEYNETDIAFIKRYIKEYTEVAENMERQSTSQLDTSYKEAKSYKAMVEFLQAVVLAVEQPDMSGADAFKRTVTFLLYARNYKMNQATAMNFVTQAQSLINDNNIRHRMLYVLSDGGLTEEVKREICKGLIRCGEATTIQDYDALIGLSREPEMIMRLFEEMEKKASADIAAEMSNQPYDISKITLIVNTVNSTITNAVRYTNSMYSAQINNWALEQRKKWKLEDIIAGGPSFVKTLPTSTYERLVEAQSELEGLHTKEQHNASTIISLRAENEQLRTQEESLRAEISKLKAEKNAIEKERDSAKSDLDTIIQASSSVKTGIFGGGSKQLKDAIAVIRARKGERDIK